MSDTPREVSRRAVLKRLLAGGAILAVPLISAIVTPNDAHAAFSPDPPPSKGIGKGGKGIGKGIGKGGKGG
jgi:hypothetical protein